jgi:hypothetical protein
MTGRFAGKIVLITGASSGKRWHANFPTKVPQSRSSRGVLSASTPWRPNFAPPAIAPSQCRAT